MGWEEGDLKFEWPSRNNWNTLVEQRRALTDRSKLDAGFTGCDPKVPSSLDRAVSKVAASARSQS
jgi:hypothetical protein